MVLRIISCLFITLILSAPVAAQDDRSALEETLKWFPIGYYGSVTHCDYFLLNKSPLYREHEDAFEPSNYSRTMEILPPSLREDIDSFTQAQRTKLQRFSEEDILTEIIENKTTGEDGKPKTEKSVAYKGVKPEKLGNVTVNSIMYTRDKNKKAIAIVDIGSNYLVFRYANLDSLIDKALVAGEIETTKEHIRDRAVYAFRQKDYTGKDLHYLAYATPTQELLVSHRVEDLLDMVAAGRGESLSIIDQPENQFIYGLINNMGPRWHCWNMLALFVVRQKHLVEIGANPDEIAYYQEEIDGGPSYQLDTDHFDDEYTSLQIIRYSTEETMNLNLKGILEPFKGFESGPEKMNEYYRTADKLTTKTVDKDNYMITVSTVIEENLLAQKAEAKKLRREWVAELQKKREQQKQ